MGKMREQERKKNNIQSKKTNRMRCNKQSSGKYNPIPA